MTKPSGRPSLSDPYVKTSVLPRWTIDRESFGRWSERFARYLGTSTFLLQMTVFIAAWILWNALAPERLRWDPYAFLFLTLILSLQASYAAPLILLAQNRQDDRDRISLEEDRSRAAQTKADTEYLARELAALRMKVNDVATRDYLRGELDRLRGDLAELAERLTAPSLVGAAAGGAPSGHGDKEGKPGGGKGKRAKESRRAADLAGPVAATTPEPPGPPTPGDLVTDDEWTDGT